MDSNPLTLFGWIGWQMLTRLGEALILLPICLVNLWALARLPSTRTLAWHWGLGLWLAVWVAVFSKVAFIGWGIGLSSLNFTGVSGHSMVAAAIYPLSFGIFLSSFGASKQKWAITTGFCLAIMIGVSRIAVGAHTVFEVLIGLLLGMLVSLIVLHTGTFAQVVVRAPVALAALVWLLISPLHTPQFQTHQWITSLSLTLSGNQIPYTRVGMLKALDQGKP